MATAPTLTGKEIFLGQDEFIVSKTDDRGRITYVNRVFIRLAGYVESELMGSAHNIIRHPEMPRSVFKLLWDTVQDGREIFAYVVNRCKNGDHYWVFAHVTPSFDDSGRIVGYHSNRRAPCPEAIKKIIPIYKLALTEEAKHNNPKRAAEAGLQLIGSLLEDNQMAYDEFVFSL